MDKVTFQVATKADLPIIHQLANEIWWPTYRAYIAHDQINLMLELIYSEEALQAQLAAGQRFSLALRGGIPTGFAGFQCKREEPQTMRIEKLYVRQSEQGKGTGKSLIDHVAQNALTAGCSCLELNVNRCNPAAKFYERQGFSVVGAVDIPYHGYVLNDYIMQKQLNRDHLTP